MATRINQIHTAEKRRKFGNGFARADVTDITDVRKKEEAIDRIEKVQRQNILTLRAVAILIKSFALKKSIFLRVLIVSSVQVVKKCLKRWKCLLRAIDKSSSFYRLLAINNISRIKLNGYDEAKRLTAP